MPFLFLNSIALMEANQKEPSRWEPRARPELGGMLSLPARVGVGTRVQRALLPLPTTSAASRGAWALLLRLLVRRIRSGLEGG